MNSGRRQPKAERLNRRRMEQLNYGEAILSTDKVSGEWFFQPHGWPVERVSKTDAERAVASGDVVPLNDEGTTGEPWDGVSYTGNAF